MWKEVTSPSPIVNFKEEYLFCLEFLQILTIFNQIVLMYQLNQAEYNTSLEIDIHITIHSVYYVPFLHLSVVSIGLFWVPFMPFLYNGVY